MRILLIGFTKLKYMPYLHYYLERINASHNEVHILTWNRDGGTDDDSDSSVVIHEFKRRQMDDARRITKIPTFLAYRRYARSVISSIGFDRIVVLHSLTGIVVGDVLWEQYQNRYILDYRDYTYEDFSPFKKRVSRLSSNAAMTFVSSDAFRSALPKENPIHTLHNLDLKELKEVKPLSVQTTIPTPIRIAFWGLIRYESVNEWLIRSLCNDFRFELHYYGREQEIASNLKRLVCQLNASNVIFHGEYKNSERFDFVKENHIINNIYDIKDPSVPRAVSNKYYDGLIAKMPQLCMEGTYQAKLVSEKGIGLACDPYSRALPDAIFDYYNSISWDKFGKRCDDELARITDEQEVSIGMIDEFLEGNSL